MMHLSPMVVLAGLLAFLALPAPVTAAGAFPRLESRFDLPGLQGNPFDYIENDVRVDFRTPDGKTLTVPAFFDGGTMWRVRYTPRLAGRYAAVRVLRNGRPVDGVRPEPAAFTVAGKPGAGFVRRGTAEPARFFYDDGTAYYPLGHNVGWRPANGPAIPAIFDKMGKAGENWSRVWMCHWDGKNLDWVQDRNVPSGTIDLEVARRWDGIVTAAEKNGIRFQMVLQHHGQYSSRVNPNWNENPWNARNGGFLTAPEEFFTSERARVLTRAKYRYIVARWGYSPAVLAWELFNEVEWTDAVNRKQLDAVAAWHREMAEFLRAQDPERHLVTTSSDREIPGLYDAADFVQPHRYAGDPVAMGTALSARGAAKPIFFGEVGPSGDLHADDGGFLHRVLWSSLMSEASGVAQYWTWDVVDKKDLYGHYLAASRFLIETGLASRTGMQTITPEVETALSGSVTFGPGGGWGAARRTEYTVPQNGTVEGIGEMPAFLQGNNHREMFPAAVFHVDYRTPGTFSVTLRQIARAGAHVILRVDGQVAAEREFPAADKDTPVDVTLTVPVPAGKRVVCLENSGADWAVIGNIALAPYGPGMRAVGKASRDAAALWIYRSATAPGARDTAGSIALPNLAPGAYRALWWDTMKGAPLADNRVETQNGKPLVLRTPTFDTDCALFLAPAGRAR